MQDQVCGVGRCVAALVISVNANVETHQLVNALTWHLGLDGISEMGISFHPQIQASC